MWFLAFVLSSTAVSWFWCFPVPGVGSGSTFLSLEAWNRKWILPLSPNLRYFIRFPLAEIQSETEKEVAFNCMSVL